MNADIEERDFFKETYSETELKKIIKMTGKKPTELIRKRALMRFQTLAEWLSWQEGLHPSEIDLGLDRVRAVLCELGHQQLSCPVISVAGTNGKGSSVAMLEAIYLSAGYRVGAFTSPHLLSYNERVRLNGEPVSDQLLCDAFERIDQVRGETSLTYYEVGTLAAIEIFAHANLDVATIEAGVGGLLDEANVLDAALALIHPLAR